MPYFKNNDGNLYHAPARFTVGAANGSTHGFHVWDHAAQESCKTGNRLAMERSADNLNRTLDGFNDGNRVVSVCATNPRDGGYVLSCANSDEPHYCLNG